MSVPSVTESTAEPDWEMQLTELLDDLLQAQAEMLALLGEKRQAMLQRDLRQIQQLQPREESLCQRLGECQQRREFLLAEARQAQLPDGDLRQLSNSVAGHDQSPLIRKVSEASNRAMLLKHQSLTNWIIAQRNLLHISQLLEIIASGGQVMPTYGNSGNGSGGGHGFVLDQEA